MECRANCCHIQSTTLHIALQKTITLALHLAKGNHAERALPLPVALGRTGRISCRRTRDAASRGLGRYASTGVVRFAAGSSSHSLCSDRWTRVRQVAFAHVCLLQYVPTTKLKPLNCMWSIAEMYRKHCGSADETMGIDADTLNSLPKWAQAVVQTGCFNG